MRRRLIIPVFISHRGCPHQCLFCNQKSITGNDGAASQRQHELSSTINSWLERSPGYHCDQVQVAFYGGSFTCLDFDEQNHLLAGVRPFMESGRVGGIRLSTRPDCLDPDIIRNLHRQGVRTVEVGIQSMDDNILLKSRRGHSAEQGSVAVELLREAGFEVGVQLLPGLPGETTLTFLQTVRKVIAMAPHQVRLYPALVVRGAPLARMYSQGDFKPLSLEKAVALTARARQLFDEAGIPVIRIGLQPSEELEQQLMAGPYHPAMGELVASRLFFNEIRTHLVRLEPAEHLHIHFSDRDHSIVVGMKRSTLKRLDELGFSGRFSLNPQRDLPRGQLRFEVV